MKEESSLIERAEKYLTSARSLLEDGDYESSVSRTYYAMFYTAEALLLTKGLSFSSHRGVISAFGEHFVRTGILDREMGRQLNLAFEKRQLGDYEYTFVIAREEAEELLAQGKPSWRRSSRICAKAAISEPGAASPSPGCRPPDPATRSR